MTDREFNAAIKRIEDSLNKVLESFERQSELLASMRLFANPWAPVEHMKPMPKAKGTYSDTSYTAVDDELLGIGN